MTRNIDGYAQCFNCGKPIPKGARRCLHCEADQKGMGDLTREDMQAAAEALEQAVPGALEQLAQMAAGFNTAEAFANAIFVGCCPTCGSTEVATFEEVKGVEDPTVARCFSCGHIWCAECQQPLDNPQTKCGHWIVCEECGDEDCLRMVGEPKDCPRIARWLAEQPGTKSLAYTFDVWLLEGSRRKPFRKRGHRICRTVELLGCHTLADLHQCIYHAYGRDEEHLYEFHIGGSRPNDPEAQIFRPSFLDEEEQDDQAAPDPFGEDEEAFSAKEISGSENDFDEFDDDCDDDDYEEDGEEYAAGEITLDSLELATGSIFGYVFDLGDEWWHQINVTKVAEAEDLQQYPRIIDLPEESA